jgi:adhesin/invasin
MITRRVAARFAAIAALLAVGACQKVPLLAPSGSTITLTSAATVLPLSGTTTILAQLIEPSGSPPHSGTLVTFTTTLGSIEPSQARTDINGQVNVTFNAGTQSGTASITATSGAANVGSNGAVKIAIGVAGVGRVNVTASPTSVPAFGGQSTITANVLDINGNPLPSAPVTFSTTAGALGASQVTTDSTGSARTILTTAQQATVTASVGAQGATGGGGGTGGTTPGTGTGGGTGTTPPTAGQASGTVTVTVLNAPTIVITQPTTAPSAGLPSTYTFAVTAASSNGSAVRDVTVNWGDGTTQDLGAIPGTVPVAHIYNSAGSYVITATLTDASGNSIPVSSPVSVVATPSPTIIITPSIPSSCTGGGDCTVIFQIQVTPPAGLGIVNVTVNFGAGAKSPTAGLGGLTGSATTQAVYPAGAGPQTITVTVIDTLNRKTEGFTTINIP